MGGPWGRACRRCVSFSWCCDLLLQRNHLCLELQPLGRLVLVLLHTGSSTGSAILQHTAGLRRLAAQLVRLPLRLLQSLDQRVALLGKGMRLLGEFGTPPRVRRRLLSLQRLIAAVLICETFLPALGLGCEIALKLRVGICRHGGRKVGCLPLES